MVTEAEPENVSTAQERPEPPDMQGTRRDPPLEPPALQGSNHLILRCPLLLLPS